VAVANITHYTLQINQTRAQQRYDNLIQPSIFGDIYKNEKQNNVIGQQQVPSSEHLTHEDDQLGRNMLLHWLMELSPS
jgi:hypothetical protein